MTRKSIFLNFILLVLYLFSSAASALVQHEKLWLAVNAQQQWDADKKWLSFIYSQARLIDEAHPWQSLLIEGGVGYQLNHYNSVWLGYRYTARHPDNNFSNEQRLFQQLIWQKKLALISRMILRSRLEEITRSDQSQVALRLRERVAFELNQFKFKNNYPFIYNEFFLQLNKTHYTSRHLFSENRLFVGFNHYISNTAWWEFGYINQYIVKTPLELHSQINHIITLTYNF